MKLKSIILTATTLIALSIPTSVSAQSYDECVDATSDILVFTTETETPEACSNFKTLFVTYKAQVIMETAIQKMEETISNLNASIAETNAEIVRQEALNAKNLADFQKLTSEPN